MRGSMRVAVLCRRLDGKPRNGFERYAHNLVAGLKGAEVDPLLPNQDVRLPIMPSGSLISPPYFDIVHPLIRILKGQLRADVFHAVTDSQAIMFPWLKGKKIVTMHHVDKTPADSLSEAVFRAFYGLGTRIALRQADKIICISSQTEREVKEAYGVAADRIVTIPQALAPSFRPLPAVVKEGTIGYIGALKKRKNVEFLIRAYALYVRKDIVSPLKLVICGEGTDRPFLENLCTELGVSDRVEFRGEVREDDLVATYNSFSLFVLPSHQEGFGFPIIEAQACAVPVLTVKGALIPDEVSMTTVKCSDEKDMADKMETILSDPDLRERVIADGLRHATSFSVEELGARTKAVYRSVYGD